MRFRNLYSNISIKRKLLLIFIIQVTIPIIVIMILVYYKSTITIKEKSKKYSQDIMKFISLNIEDFTQNMANLSLDLIYDNRIYKIIKDDMTQEDMTQDGESIYYKYKSSTDINNILRKAVQPREEIQTIYIGTMQKTFFVYDTLSGRTNTAEDLPFDKMAKVAKTMNGKATWFVEQNKNEEAKIYLIRMIIDKDNFNDLGILAIKISNDVFDNMFDDFITEELKNIYILSKEGHTIYKKQATDIDYLRLCPFEYDLEKQTFYEEEKDQVLISSIQLKDTGWEIRTFTPLESLYHEIKNFQKWLVVLMIIILGTLSLFSILTSIDIIYPINKMVDAMKKYDIGKSIKILQVERTDEIGYLSTCLENMTERIEGLIHLYYNEEITRKEAELKALQSQINPHFLFNTLESINWMAQLKGAPEVSEMVGALSNLMSGTMGKDSKKMISLKEELEYIESYTFIMKRRIGDRLKVIYNIQNQILETQVPRLLIQPVVENCILHGLKDHLKKAVIVVKGYKIDEIVCVDIIDNGKGISSLKLAELNTEFKKTEFNQGDSINNRIGLYNVNQRIKLHFGQCYGIQIVSRAGCYTKVEMRLPSQTKGENICIKS